MITENTPELWLSHLPSPAIEGNKYDRGYVVVAAGGIESTGATKIAALCALRSGAGLVSVACDSASLPVYAASLSAIMTKPVEDISQFLSLIKDKHVTSVLIGCGAGINKKTKEFTLAALAEEKMVIIDADAISVFSENPKQLFSSIKSPVILTPHEGEFKRLFGNIIDMNHDRISRANKAAEISGAVVILKGHHTAIASPSGKLVVNKGSTPYLATAGSGDALAGICSSLVAGGMPAFEAACAAVWIHSRAAIKFGCGFIADDMANLLPEIFTELKNKVK
ncbi:MAG: NAD(P)H-hydrate dehydratase [Rickettsiales bacterium]